MSRAGGRDRSAGTNANNVPSIRTVLGCCQGLAFVGDLSVNPSRGPRDMSLLEYPSLYWGTDMQIEPSYRSRRLMLDLLGQYGNRISAELL